MTLPSSLSIPSGRAESGTAGAVEAGEGGDSGVGVPTW